MFGEVMSAVADEIWGVTSHGLWNNQAAFLSSEKGIEYIQALTALIDAQKKELGRNSGQADSAAVLIAPDRLAKKSR